MTRLVLVVMLLLAGCSEMGNGTGQISQRIGDVTHDPSAREVDLARLTTFGWDRFYFFRAGTPREQICRFISAGRNTCSRVVRYTAVPDGYVALFFALKGQLTHTELHAKANGQFDFDPPDDGVARARCVFRIHRTTIGAQHDEVLLELPT